MKARKKLNSRAGFTLAETLLAVLILLLVSTIVATGMPVARTAYEKVVLTSNAETLLTTAVSALRNELGTAWKVEQPSNNHVTYFSASTGTRAELYLDGDNKIKILDYAEATSLDALLGTNQNKAATTARDLVFQSDIDRLGKLTLKAGSITLDKATGKVRISGMKVFSASNVELASLGDSSDDSSDDSLVISVFSCEGA